MTTFVCQLYDHNICDLLTQMVEPSKLVWFFYVAVVIWSILYICIYSTYISVVQICM